MDTHIKNLEAQLESVVDRFRQDISGVRSGRPTTELLESVHASYFDRPTPIKQLGTISVKPPREIDVTVWDHGAVGAVLKAIQDAKLGFSPNAEGNIIRCFLPPLTEERRAELSRLVRKMAEEARIRVRHHRDEAIKRIRTAESARALNEDDVFKGKESVQKAVDEANKEIEALVESKIKELQE